MLRDHFQTHLYLHVNAHCFNTDTFLFCYNCLNPTIFMATVRYILTIHFFQITSSRIFQFLNCMIANDARAVSEISLWVPTAHTSQLEDSVKNAIDSEDGSNHCGRSSWEISFDWRYSFFLIEVGFCGYRKAISLFFRKPDPRPEKEKVCTSMKTWILFKNLRNIFSELVVVPFCILVLSSSILIQGKITFLVLCKNSETIAWGLIFWVCIRKVLFTNCNYSSRGFTINIFPHKLALPLERSMTSFCYVPWHMFSQTILNASKGFLEGFDVLFSNACQCRLVEEEIGCW